MHDRTQRNTALVIKDVINLSPLPVPSHTSRQRCNRESDRETQELLLVSCADDQSQSAELQQQMSTSQPVTLTVIPAADQHVENGGRPHSVEPGRRPSRLPFLTELLRSKGRRRDSYTVRQPNSRQQQHYSE